MTPNIFIPFLQIHKYTHILTFRVILYVHMSIFFTLLRIISLAMRNAYNYLYKILILIKSTSIDA